MTARALVASSVLTGAAIAQGGVDLKVNGDPPGSVQNEVVLALNVANTGNLVMAFNDRAGMAPPPATPIGVATTMNGGAVWLDQQLGVPADPFAPGQFLDTIFDPALAWGPPNEFYVCYIATRNANCPQSGLFIERSDDGGINWSGPQALAIDPPEAFPGDPNYRFNDRVHMDTAAHGFVTVTWIKDVTCAGPGSDIYFTYGGPIAGPINQPPFPPANLAPFSAPVIVNDNPGGIDLANAPHVATHPIGKTYVAWIDFNPTAAVPDATTGVIRIDSTTIPTGLPVFGVDMPVVTIDPLPRFVSTSVGVWDDARGYSYPTIVVDENDGSGNTIYMTYAEDPPGPDEGDVFFIASTNGGVTWSAPLRVNDDTTTNDQMHPHLVQFPPGGTIWVAWYDKRASATDSAWEVYLARSTDLGASFSANVLVSDAPFAAPVSGVPWLGEYLGLESDGRDALVGFTKSTFDVRGDVFFDRVQGCQFPIFNYCTAGTTTNGCTPAIGSSGTPSASAGSGFTLAATGVEGQKQGLVFYGLAPRSATTWGASSSFLCMKSPTQRTPTQNSGAVAGACGGTISIDWNAYIAANPSALGQPFLGGEIVRAQAWFRDPPSPKTTNLSDALEFTTCP